MAALNLNTASGEDLEKLPLIGPKRAAHIVSFRARHGWFRSVEELSLVPGIGPRIVERLRPLLIV